MNTIKPKELDSNLLTELYFTTYISKELFKVQDNAPTKDLFGSPTLDFLKDSEANRNIYFLSTLLKKYKSYASLFDNLDTEVPLCSFLTDPYLDLMSNIIYSKYDNVGTLDLLRTFDINFEEYSLENINYNDASVLLSELCKQNVELDDDNFYDITIFYLSSPLIDKFLNNSNKQDINTFLDLIKPLSLYLADYNDFLLDYDILTKDKVHPKLPTPKSNCSHFVVLYGFRNYEITDHIFLEEASNEVETDFLNPFFELISLLQKNQAK